jgi:hypothetical protein
MVTLFKRYLLTVIASVSVLNPFGKVWALVDDSAASWAYDGTRDALIPELQKFFGTATGHYVYIFYEHESNDSTAVRQADGEYLVFDQFMALFSVLALPPVPLSNGRRLLVATMPHQSSEQSIVVTSGDSTEIVAAAMVYLFCPAGGVLKPVNPPRRFPCADKSALTIFYPKDAAPDTQLTDDITNWVLKDQQLRNARVGIATSQHMRRFIRRL